ncbi:MAG: hypothetical protein RIT24_1473 [Planctomycetota bacterium]|jgi:hypothetical protein
MYRIAMFAKTAALISAFCAGAARADQRAEALAAVRDIPAGARIVDTAAGSVLVASAVVPVPTDLRADKAYSMSAAAALIEARAEAALFLGGEYSSTTESGLTSKSGTSDGSKAESWAKSHAVSQARVRFTGGELLEIARAEGGVRAVVAWGLSQAGAAVAADEVALGALADSMIADTEVPACMLEWIKDKDGREGLRFSVAIHPDGALGPCAKNLGAGCSCVACRKRVLELQVQKTIGGWANEGDVAVARSLTRVSKRTESRAKEGRVAVERMSERTRSSSSDSSVQCVIPGDFFRKSTVVYRHSDARSVCVGFVPIDAVSGASGQGDIDERSVR